MSTTIERDLELKAFFNMCGILGGNLFSSTDDMKNGLTSMIIEVLMVIQYSLLRME